MPSFRYAACVVALSATAALSDGHSVPDPLGGGTLEGEVDNLCDGSLTVGNAWDIPAIYAMVGGTWSQSAQGERFTRGIQMNTLEIVLDPASQGLQVKGQVTVNLNPIPSATIASGMGLDRLGDMTINYKETGYEDGVGFDGSLETTADQALGIWDCEPENTPIFWWQLNATDAVGAPTGNISYGMIIFVTERTAFGWMENNAQGRRSFIMYR